MLPSPLTPAPLAPADLLPSLLARAWRERVVLSAPLASGLQLLVYPDGDDALVGLGYDGAGGPAQRPGHAALLQRRGGAMATLGRWLPAAFVDGSLYLLRRVAGADPAAWPAEAELLAALAVLA